MESVEKPMVLLVYTTGLGVAPSPRVEHAVRLSHPRFKFDRSQIFPVI